MNVYLICGFAAICCSAGCVLKQIKPELLPVFIALSGCVLIGFALQYVEPLIAELNQMAALCGVEGWFGIVLKALAGTVGCAICADFCRDCGEASLASKVEFAGRVYVLLLSFPIVKQLLLLTKGLLS